ncbi:hypothetical protein J6590_015172 [Homalodisca vitripennis]|nr:hypothetical protein J6590_015172 [Homalodisca vitripennis]
MAPKLSDGVRKEEFSGLETGLMLRQSRQSIKPQKRRSALRSVWREVQWHDVDSDPLGEGLQAGEEEPWRNEVQHYSLVIWNGNGNRLRSLPGSSIEVRSSRCAYYPAHHSFFECGRFTEQTFVSTIGDVSVVVRIILQSEETWNAVSAFVHVVHLVKRERVA